MPLFSKPTLGIQLAASYDGVPVTPADGTDLPAGPSGKPCIGIAVTGPGNVNVDLTSGGTAVLTGLSAGQIVDVAVKRVRSTSTTATGIFALY
ncbi:MAG: hypothetical protein U1F67_10415 [Rubrivivax sp.]